jgi:glutamate synthase domain-containing protein 3
VAEKVLDEWPGVLTQFVKIMPTDYKRVLAERRCHDEEMEAIVREELTLQVRALGS